MNNQDIAKHSAAMLDLFESEQQRILLLDPKERAMQHNYQKTMAVCYELRTFIRSIDAKPSAVLEAAPASSAMAQAVDAREINALLSAYDSFATLIGGCSDGGCIIKRPTGMHTNGGCKCSKNYMDMQRMMNAANKFRDGVAKLSELQPQQSQEPSKSEVQ